MCDASVPVNVKENHFFPPTLQFPHLKRGKNIIIIVKL